MALTQDQKFKVRYYLGFPDLSSLPPNKTEDEEEIKLLRMSSELEVRLVNLTSSAETMVISLLGQLDTAFAGIDTATDRLPFKRIEDITFRDDELTLRWNLNSDKVNKLALIVGIKPLMSIGSTGIGLEVV